MTSLPYPGHPLSDGRTALRRWSAEDTPAITAACQDPEIQRFISDLPVPYSEADARAFLEANEHVAAEGCGLALAIVDPDSRVIGAVAADMRREDRSGEVGYWLAPAARGRGHASAALRLFCSYLLNELGCERIALQTAPENLASQRVAASCGFRPEGYLHGALRRARDGRRGDAILWGLLKHGAPPADRRVVWINGAFGAGKSSTTAELQRRHPDLIAFDPEALGSVLRAFLPMPTGDFQDLAEWRRSVSATVASIAQNQAGPVLVPMTLLRQDYLLEIFAGLRAQGVGVTHVLLDAADPVLSARIDADTTQPAEAMAFRRRKLPDYGRARHWLSLHADYVLDVGELSVSAVAERISRLLSPAGIRGPG